MFLDGLGLGPPEEANPLANGAMPRLFERLGVPLVAGAELEGERALLRGIDARLGVDGLPQSASGQAALFTGVNAPKLLGRHLSAYPNERLAELIDERCLLKAAAERGLKATFANAYTPFYFEWVARGRVKHSATTLCVLAAGLPFRTLEDLERGEAVFWDITHEQLAGRYRRPVDVPIIEPELAGRRLAALGQAHDLVLYESFLPDLFGHRAEPSEARKVIAILDRFLDALLGAAGEGVTVVVASDHGNLEDSTTRLHTLNPVPLLAVGPAAKRFEGVRDIAGVTPAIMAVLDRPAGT